MALREDIDKLLVEVNREREDARAEAGRAAEDLIRLASGMTPLDEVDADGVRAAADTYADAVTRLQSAERMHRAVMRLLT